MADGKNMARAIRITEIMYDYRTLQTRIESYISRPESNPPEEASGSFTGYEVLKRLKGHSKVILARQFNPRDVVPRDGKVPNTDEHKAVLKRFMLDCSARRLEAQKVFSELSCAMEWAALYQQVKEQGGEQQAPRLGAVDGRLVERIRAITSYGVFNDLRKGDTRSMRWIDEDPPLNRIEAWLQSSHH